MGPSKCQKAIELFFHMVLFIALYKVVPTFTSANETLECDHSNESYQAVLSSRSVHYAVQGGCNFKPFKSVDQTPMCDYSTKSY